MVAFQTFNCDTCNVMYYNDIKYVYLFLKYHYSALHDKNYQNIAHITIILAQVCGC